MNCIVCIKQVPDTAKVKLDPKTHRLQRAGVENIMNPFDEHALEAALALRDAHGGTVTVLTMGPPQAEDVLRESIARGADRAVLVTDRTFGGADTLATSYTLAGAIRHLGGADVILCGKQAIDGDTAQVGPQIAEMLDLPQVTSVNRLACENGHLTVTREHEDGYETLTVALPALLTVTKNLNTPRYPSLMGKMKARKAPIETLTAAELNLDAERIGIKGSPTRVRRVYTPEVRTQGIIWQDLTPETAARQLQDILGLGGRKDGAQA